MFFIEQLILLGAVLILLGIFSSKISARLGLPLLVLFLMIGMLAGEDGVGQINFDNPEIAHALGTLALAIILFDGGLQTPFKAIRQVWKPASLLATLGVLVTAMLTGVAASYVLPISLLEGLLLGAIVGSTDAAAVFSLLRNADIHLNTRLKSTLEIESASNDPMAIFLTVALLQILTTDTEPGVQLFQMFFMQMGLGALFGLTIGYLAVKVINKINLQVNGLYPILVTASGLLSFGLAANLGGSGFLAIFVCGVMIGNKQFAFQRFTFLFHDGLAWLSQITMFVVLGLLIMPSSLLSIWWQGLLIAGVLVFIARPLAVIPILKLFKFNIREITLVSWVGLRGSVPIILAIFPLMYGLPSAQLLFNVVFFVVLISATLQGGTLPWVARKLKLIEEPPASAPATLEITALADVDAEIVEFTLSDDSRAVGRRISQMALPEGTVVAMITRGDDVLPPRGSTILRSNDHLFVFSKFDYNKMAQHALSEKGFKQERPMKSLRMKGTSRVSEIDWSYDTNMLDFIPDTTLADLCRQQLGEVTDGAEFTLADLNFRVEEQLQGKAITVTIHKSTAAKLPAEGK